MQTRYICSACRREIVFATTGLERCPVCHAAVMPVQFEPIVVGLDSTTTAADLPCPAEEIPALEPTPLGQPPPLVLMGTPAYLLDLGERL